ncbi:N-formylglutamate amidohydrolase [Sphingosinicella sp.]|uniref:N-formylglutamate amidohydrolase n=1 Tax=Sphingosinicella sp. TaxID=1917971 RepID=UPI0040376659
MTDAEPPPPFIRIGPDRPESPIVISVPHAGRAYSHALLAASRLHRSVLESLEDRLVDRLVWRAVEHGAVAFLAQAPRAEIDLNREESEIDPALIAPPPPLAGRPTARARGGLGLIPSRINGSGAIWRQRIPAAELERRLDEIHRPYHAALAAALAAARARFGGALLLDVHSMPPRREPGGEAGPQIVFGDRHGTACAAPFMAEALAVARLAGWRARANAPYAGGHIVERHGRPARHIHALQIELCRSAYLDVTLENPGRGFAPAAELIAAIAAALETRLLGPDLAVAAE